ncbi:MAG: response regulator, partial [Dehalococcoidia bacterium]
MTELLLGTELTSKQRRFTETVQRSGETLLMIINDILDFSKIEAGKLELEHADFELRQVVEEVVDLFTERARHKGLELVYLIHDEVPTALRGDQHRLRQILTNLLGNAFKFTEQGEVAVDVSKVEEGEGRALIRFAVRDTGIGISAEAKARIFQSFSQADGSTTRKYGGTGLGLTISKQLAELMGGEIGVESEVGTGSIFWWTARLEKQAAAAPSRLEPTHNLQGLRVLVVDDNETNREILHYQVSSWGMRSDSAESGSQALQMLYLAAARHKPYDIAILDMYMPEMDGVQLARAIKADPAIAGVRLVMLSSGLYRIAEARRGAGIEAYLTKPVRQSELYNCLGKAMGFSEEVDARGSGSPASSEEVPAQVPAYVLLAEDNPVNQEVALGMLELFGCRTDVANNGREAVEAVSRTAYDVVLMDCHMPELNGFEATKTIREQEALLNSPRLPIIALTANALAGDREMCLTLGMDDYLSKPFKQEELRSMLLRWSRQSAGEEEQNQAKDSPSPEQPPSSPTHGASALPSLNLPLGCS